MKLKNFNFQPGFTLLEVLIALTLVSTLMMLGWSLLSNFTKLNKRSRKAVAHLEITRSLRRQLQNDLDQLADLSLQETQNSADKPNILSLDFSFQTTSPPSSNDSVKEGLTVLQSDSKEPPISNRTTSLLPSSHLFEGGSDSLSFLIHNDGSLNFFTSNEQFFVVSYYWRDAPKTGPLDEINPEESGSFEANEFETETETDNNPFNRKPPRDFVRSVMTYQDYRRQFLFHPRNPTETQLENFETIEIGRPDPKDGLPQPPIREQVDVIPEISEVNFRYFNGQSWSDFWPESETELPVAVEIVFQVDPEKNTKKTDETVDEFGDSIETGDTSDSIFEEDFDLGNSLEDDQRIREFDPNSKRFLIRLGSEIRPNPQGFGDKLEQSADFESDFEGLQ
ncbi:MAG: prepilin-type N-terminal cleavage/methylation domain-containing protein [Planctomycetota bacterium]|nr:prepilin-type N-terminal cleavage/methylation domain-containing protein [Planctomycetota bacterium]